MMDPMNAEARRTFGSRTDVGRVREHNEDSLVVQPPLYVVCDGMGGHAAGEVASEMAVDVIAQRAPLTADAEQLGQAVEEANLAIIRAAAHGVGREGMGTTCTAAMVEGTRLVIAQVGDSRAYLVHAGRIQQLTRDHSLVADLVESGQITAEEARMHPNRSVITRALGSDPRMQCDLYEMNVDEGDRLLLCSDGLYSMIDDVQIERIMNMCPDAQDAADMLAEAAVDAGGHDNVTAIVVNVMGDAATRHWKLARKTKVTMTVVAILVVLAFIGAFAGFNLWISTVAYLGEVDGRVAVYQGIPGDVLGVSFSNLREVTDVSVDSLQPGVANRVRNHDIRCDSLDAAHGLIEQYRLDVFDSQKSAVPQGNAATGDSATTGGDTAASDTAVAGTDGAATAQPDQAAQLSGDAA